MAQAGPRGRARRRTGERREPRVEAVGDEEQATSEGPKPPLCSFGLCPICLALIAFGDARPDLMEHLITASREMLLALRALIDARLQSSEPPARLERLTIR